MGDIGKSKLSGLGGFLPVYHAPGKRFFLPWLTFHLWAGEIDFLVKGLFGKEKKLDFSASARCFFA